MNNTLPTDPYKGTRDFYPEDMAVQRYIFATWSKAAEKFGFERYDASVLEPSELYKSKGAENEELVNEQTYTFIDRGEREVTLRPEMTPTVARMVAHKRRELSYPVRWYSIPNLFRYERPQRGRLREHWQLNCDIFLPSESEAEVHLAADAEIIALASSVLSTFGANDTMYEIRINDKGWLRGKLEGIGIQGDLLNPFLRLLDKRNKIADEMLYQMASEVVGDALMNTFKESLPQWETELSAKAIFGALRTLGITNVKPDIFLVRGFDYYTGTIFEIFDVSTENTRSLLGGGRYDNLTTLFGGEPISGIGFGMGDVTMRDFLLTHTLLPPSVRITAPALMILPMEPAHNLEGLRIAEAFRAYGITASVDTSTRKIGKKISIASERGVGSVVVLGTDELAAQVFTLKNLASGEEKKGSVEELSSQI